MKFFIKTAWNLAIVFQIYKICKSNFTNITTKESSRNQHFEKWLSIAVKILKFSFEVKRKINITQQKTIDLEKLKKINLRKNERKKEGEIWNEKFFWKSVLWIKRNEMKENFSGKMFC